MNLKPIEHNLLERLRNRRVRERFIATLAKDEIASQIRKLRVRRGFLTQEAFAREAKMQQSAVSRIEQADYSGWTFRTLLKVAFALRARLHVTFEPLENVIAASETSERAAELQHLTVSDFVQRESSAFAEDVTDSDIHAINDDRSYHNMPVISSIEASF